jgi:hypothetical protein
LWTSQLGISVVVIYPRAQPIDASGLHLLRRFMSIDFRRRCPGPGMTAIR